jgi:hypothetical protein
MDWRLNCDLACEYGSIIKILDGFLRDLDDVFDARMGIFFHLDFHPNEWFYGGGGKPVTHQFEFAISKRICSF